jgi:hypothetical protein
MQCNSISLLEDLPASPADNRQALTLSNKYKRKEINKNIKTN